MFVSRGFTLAESLIASVVLATAVVGIATALAFASSQSTAMDTDLRAVALARQLLEEVLSCPFEAPAANDNAGWNAGNHVKSTYDNIADFDGYTDTLAPAAAAPAPQRDPAATRLSYQREVAFEYRNTPGGAPVIPGDMGLITVTVTPIGSGSPYTLNRLVAKCTIARD